MTLCLPQMDLKPSPEQRFFENQRLVTFIARRLYQSLHIELEDAIAWGHLGLWQACQKDHPVWEAYMRIRIAGAIKDGARVLHRRPRSQDPYEEKYPTVVHFSERFEPPVVFDWPDEAPSYQNLYQAMAELSSRESEIVRRSFFKEDKLKDIAEEYGVSEARISIIRTRALLKIRKRLKELEGPTSNP